MNQDLITVEIDPDKKEYITRASLDKMLRDIKALLVRKKKIKIIISQE
jgi:hypothetical protein